VNQLHVIDLGISKNMFHFFRLHLLLVHTLYMTVRMFGIAAECVNACRHVLIYVQKRQVNSIPRTPVPTVLALSSAPSCI
jgi:hypothetical protein